MTTELDLFRQPFKQIRDISTPHHENTELDKLIRKGRYVSVDEDRKNHFATWVRNVYTELYNIPGARIIMNIVAHTPNVEIIFKLDDSRLTCNFEGMTFPNYREIYIAAGGFDFELETPMETDGKTDQMQECNQKNAIRDKIKGLIIHEFCHHAVYVIFCNNAKAFYCDDEEYKKEWENVKNECDKHKDKENMITEAFGEGYEKQDQILSELVVRWFQYNIEYLNNTKYLDDFNKNFPLLKTVCEEYVCTNLLDEYKKILAIYNINEAVTVKHDSSLYKKRAVTTNFFIFAEIMNTCNASVQIFKTNCASLATNYIFHEIQKYRLYHYVQYVFLNYKYLNDDDNFNNFETAMQRKVQTFFVIDFNNDEFGDFIKHEEKVKEYLIKYKSFLLILLDEKQSYKNNDNIINFKPSDLTVEFINDVKINFQGKQMSLVELITVREFQNLSNLPSEKICKERISIGNQMKLHLIPEYIERTLLIKSQSNGKWEKLDDFGNTFTINKRVLVTNEPGAGKSIESIKMYYRLKDKYPNDWIVHINLSRLVEVFEEEKKKFHTYSQSEKFRTLFCHSILKLNEFERDLFEFMMKSGRVVFIFDSLDEISPFYFQLVRNLTEMIFLTFFDQRIIIFTRPHLVIEMEEFKFTVMKIDWIKENDLITNILMIKYSCKSQKTRDNIKNSVQSFLQKRNFHTPLLIRMVTEVASMKELNSDGMTLYDIYKYFCNQFDIIQELTSENIKAEKLKLTNIDKYFQKRSVEKLLEYRVSSEFDLWSHEIIEASKEDLILFKDDFFSDWTDIDLEKVQRKGITIHSKSNPKEFDLIHASFNDFYIADFIISEIKSLVKDHKTVLMEIFSMLYQESRLNNVIEFLKGHKNVAKYLKEFDVISQMIEDTKVENGVNIMPIIKFIAGSISGDSFIRNICEENKLYSSMILLTDPIKTLEKLCSFTTSYFVYKNVLMNRPYVVYQYNKYECDDHPMNILDILAQCGIEDSFGFYVSIEVFSEYFDKLILNQFMFGHIASMMKNSFGKSNRSFFLMAKNKNKIVIEIFLDFYEKLLKIDSYFFDPKFCSFISILILNSECNDQKLINLIEKVVNFNKKSEREPFFCSTKIQLAVEWACTMRKSIKHFRIETTLKQFEKAVDFYFHIISNVSDESYSDQFYFWNGFILSLLDEQLFEIFKIVVNRLADKYENTNTMLRDILLERDYEDMTILQNVFCINTNDKDQITDFTFRYYKRIFGYNASEIHNLLLEPKFFIKLFLAQNDNSRIISSIMQFINNAENETDSWLELMISYSNCIKTNLIDSLLAVRRTKYPYSSLLRELSFTNKNPELPKFMKIILHECINSQNYSEVFFEIFSNEVLTRNQLEDILEALLLEDKMLKSRINQIFIYKHPKDDSTVIIAASKCKQAGRIEILMKVLDDSVKYYSDSKLLLCYNSCLLATDEQDKSALFYLLRNKHQENFFLTFLGKVESNYANELKETDQLRELIFSIFEDKILYDTLVVYEDDVSEERYKVLEKLFEALSRDEQKNQIFKTKDYEYSCESLFEQVITQSSRFSTRLLNMTLKSLFENEYLYLKVLKKLKRFSGHGGRLLVNADMFSSAFNSYKLKGSDEVIDHLHRVFNTLKSSLCHNLSNGNFNYFRQDRVIRHLISKIKNDKYHDESDKIFIVTFIFMLNCNDYVHLLENVKKEIQNYDQLKERREFLYSLIKSTKMDIDELKVVFEKEFSSYLTENSYRFLHEFLNFIESMCVNKTDFHTFLDSQLSEIKYHRGNNIFHQILYNSEKDSNSNMYFDIYETLKIKLGGSKVLNDLHRKTNNQGETPIMLALKYTNIEKCLKFFSENFVESMRDLLQIYNNQNEISQIVFKNLFRTNETTHDDFESIIKPLAIYFNDSELNEMFKNAFEKKSSRDQNFIHVLFESEYALDEKIESNKYFSLLFDEMKKRFGVGLLTTLILEENKFKQNPLEVINMYESFKPYLELIEKHFQSETVINLLKKNGGTHYWILYKNYEVRSTEDKMFTVQFYKKYFPQTFENMLTNFFMTSDCDGFGLIYFYINTKEDDGLDSFDLFSRWNSLFKIVSDNISDTKCIKTIFSRVNIRGQTILAIDNFEDLTDYVEVIKLTEFYFSRDVVISVFKIEDSVKLQKMFLKAKDIDRCEMIELLKNYYPDEWTKVFNNSQVQSIKVDKRSPPIRRMEIIHHKFEKYGYAICELLSILKKKLSNFEKRIEQENNFQGYGLVIHDYREGLFVPNSKYLLLQAVFSIPRENLTNTRINERGIEWQYDEMDDTFTNLNCNNENQEFSLDMISETCIAIKSYDKQVKVLAPIENSRNSYEF